MSRSRFVIGSSIGSLDLDGHRLDVALAQVEGQAAAVGVLPTDLPFPSRFEQREIRGAASRWKAKGKKANLWPSR